MLKSRRLAAAAAAVGFALFGSQFAHAQTGVDLMGKPMPKGQYVQSTGDARFFGDGNNDRDTGGGQDFQLQTYDLRGRGRLWPEQRADPRFGFDLKQFEVSSDIPGFPEHMTDVSVAFGMGVGENKDQGWQAGASVGIGYAGVGAFDDGNAIYGKADFLIGWDFGNDETLAFVLDYDGNRTYKPDIPFPGFRYTKRIEQRLLLAVGFPYTSIEWKPYPDLLVRLQYNFPDDGEATIDYNIVKDKLGVFASYRVRQEAWHWDDLPDGKDRLLFQQRMVEAGLRYTPLRWDEWGEMSFILSGGYAFSQEFNAGWDSSDPDRVAKPSDEPFVRIGFEFRY